MDLTIANLQKLGAFTGAPVKMEIVWQQGDKECKADVYVRQLSYHSTVAELMAFSGRHDAVAGRIAACICDADGKAIFTPEDITGESDPARGPLDAAITIALLDVIAKANGLGEYKPEPKDLVTSTSSGTS
jgi:hypothetical protein